MPTTYRRNDLVFPAAALRKSIIPGEAASIIRIRTESIPLPRPHKNDHLLWFGSHRDNPLERPLITFVLTEKNDCRMPVYSPRFICFRPYFGLSFHRVTAKGQFTFSNKPDGNWSV
jgi:hypothetical protein